ncbi:HNH endonuclease [Azospirillum baldaniorum]|uniref:HNH endonuclease n=1 Tax=Azospirillum baldaniorum TaxID=1064539 RepID=UPI00157B37E3|nr:HNH endonuclease [Azospirillum baldaniorum]
MPLLYYWRGDNYARDLDFGVAYHLNQANPLLHEVELGDSLWAFTRRRDGVYVLAAELVASAKTLNPKGYRYGPYRLWGDLRRSRYFRADGQPDITMLIRRLSVRAGADVLGRAFQGHAAVRRLTEADHQLLAVYAAEMPLEPRARLVPEERLEALLLAGDEAAVAVLIRDEAPGLAAERRRYLTTEAIRRDRQHVEALRALYDGRCQICEWAPRARYGADICEGHHVRWLSRGGQDDLSNMVLICPNHHRVLHRVDAPFDFAAGGFQVGQASELLALVRHDIAA